MKVKICVNNFDLHAKHDKEKEFIGKLLAEKKNAHLTEVEWNELHCLGYCYWCQMGPMAIVDDCLVTISESE